MRSDFLHVLSDADAVLYAEWKRYGRHFQEYACEFVGTLFLVFCVVGAVALMFSQSSPVPAAIPSTWLRLLLTGLILGAVGWAVALSPLGRLSGAHLNPALSLGLWLLEKMHHKDLLGYVAAQLAGGVAGALLGRAAFGRWAEQVRFAALQPAASIGGGLSFAGEAGTTLVLCLVVFTCMGRQSLLRWTPAAATAAVALLVCVDGNYSGCGMNPARWLGPAFVAQLWRFAFAYAAGPLVGTAAAVLLHRSGLLADPVPRTGKLYQDRRYRSIFRHDAAPSAIPEVARPRESAQR